MLAYCVIEIRSYAGENGNSPFDAWLDDLNAQAAVRIVTALARIENGNFSNVKAVGQGVSECKIHFGPGYRVYFGKDGERLVILLGGGTKKRQSRDIAAAQANWKDYKRRKRIGE